MVHVVNMDIQVKYLSSSAQSHVYLGPRTTRKRPLLAPFSSTSSCRGSQAARTSTMRLTRFFKTSKSNANDLFCTVCCSTDSDTGATSLPRPAME